MGHVAGMGEKCIKGFSEETRGWGPLSGPKSTWDGMDWSHRLKIGTDGRILCRWSIRVGLHKMRGISLLLEKLLASREGLLVCGLISYASLPGV